MGMFDWINYECVCPVCHGKVDGFQSKDNHCTLASLQPNDVDSFYSDCGKCGCWIEFERENEGSEKFLRKIKSKKLIPMEKYNKLIKIRGKTKALK